VDEPSTAAWLSSEVEVLGHRHVRQETQFLGNDRGTDRKRGRWRTEPHVTPIEPDLATIGRFQPHEDVQKCGFSGAVTPAQSGYATRTQFDRPSYSAATAVVGLLNPFGF
jgi:hypothetical protein